MTTTHPEWHPRRISLLSLIVIAAVVGCSDDSKQSGTQAPPAPEQVQAQNNMADFMKGQKGSGGNTPKKASPPAK